jgi:hypothetical protein
LPINVFLKLVTKYFLCCYYLVCLQIRRTVAADVSKPASPKHVGGGLISRISSFFVGAGLTALVTQFYIFQEIREGNKSMLAKQKDLDARLKKLEGS